jgi:hypothetical protein
MSTVLAGNAIAAVRAGKHENKQPEAASLGVEAKILSRIAPTWQTPVKPVRAGPAQRGEASGCGQMAAYVGDLAPVTPEKQDVATQIAADLPGTPMSRQRGRLRPQPAVTRSRTGSVGQVTQAAEREPAPREWEPHSSLQPGTAGQKVSLADLACETVMK